MKTYGILNKVEAYVSQLFKQKTLANKSFHNLDHTKNVVHSTTTISNHLGIEPQHQSLLIIAAWFHDIGYIKQANGHESSSKKIARRYLQNNHFHSAEISLVLDCIEATRMPQQPRNLLEKIICDADLSHLANEDYADWQSRLRKEWADELGKYYSDKEWLKENLNFLQSHQYFTSYGKQVLQQGKARNISKYLQNIPLSNP